MTQRISVFGFGVKLGAGIAVGAFLGLGLVTTAGYLALRLSPSKESSEKEVAENAGESKD